MEIKRGQIYWIYRNEDRPAFGSVQDPGPGRPGIVVSNDANNIHSDAVEIVYLTTAPKTSLPTHCTITSADKTSTALCEQITTVSVNQVGKHIGTCTADEMRKVENCMITSLGLPVKAPAPAPVDDSELNNLRLDNAMYMAQIEKMKLEIARHQARETLLQDLYNDLLKAKLT